MPRIFISHSSADTAEARRIHDLLANDSFEALFLDAHPDDGIKTGDNWEARLYSEISRSSAMLLLLSKAWFESRWCLVEFALARTQGKKLLPYLVLRDEREFVNGKLKELKLGQMEDGDARLLDDLRALWPTSAAGFRLLKDLRPYVGMRSMEADDAAVFFGRDPEVEDVISLLRGWSRLHDSPRCLLLHGDSGVGKSSLLRAGILPRLARMEKCWNLAPPFRPGIAPAKRLRASLENFRVGPQREATDIAGLSESVARYQEEISKLVNRPLILAIDQFEEVLVAGDAEQQHFFELLNQLTRLPQVWVLITVRGAYLAKALSCLERTEERLLKPLSPDQLGKIIREPAALVNLIIDDALVDAIKADMRSDVPLPLLGLRVVTASHDDTARQWDVATGPLWARRCAMSRTSSQPPSLDRINPPSSSDTK